MHPLSSVFSNGVKKGVRLLGVGIHPQYYTLKGIIGGVTRQLLSTEDDCDVDHETRKYLKHRINLIRRAVIGIESDSKASRKYSPNFPAVPLDLLPTTACSICGDEFKRRHPRHYICSKVECKRANTRRYRRVVEDSHGQ